MNSKKASQEIAERGGIFLNERVFVKIDMIDPLKSKDIVMSVQTCYATDSPQFSKMDVYHYLISSMCADPRDETIQAVVQKKIYLTPKLSGLEILNDVNFSFRTDFVKMIF